MANPFDQFDKPAANPFDQFDARAAAPVAEAVPDLSVAAEPEGRTAGEWLNDTALMLRRGARNVTSGLLGAPVDLINLAIDPLPARLIRGGFNALGADIKAPAEALGLPGAIEQPELVQGLRESIRRETLADTAATGSTTLAREQQGLAEADGFLETVEYLARNPQALAMFGAEQVPQLVTAIPGRLLATIGLQGVSAGSQAEAQVAEALAAEVEAGRLSPEDAAQIQADVFRASGALNTALPFLPGAQTLERVAALRPLAGRGVVGGAVRGAAGEGTQGVLSEGGDQVIANLATGRPIDEGVGQAAALGLLLEGPLGGLAGGAEGFAAGPVPPSADLGGVVPPQAPIPPVAPAGGVPAPIVPPGPPPAAAEAVEALAPVRPAPVQVPEGATVESVRQQIGQATTDAERRQLAAILGALQEQGAPSPAGAETAQASDGETALPDLASILNDPNIAAALDALAGEQTAPAPADAQAPAVGGSPTTRAAFPRATPEALDRALAMDEDAYIAAVNPEGKRSSAEDEIAFSANDIQAPDDAVAVPEFGFTDRQGKPVTVLEAPDGTLYAQVEGKTVGLVESSNGETLNQVAKEFQGRGIGTGLIRAQMLRDPMTPAGSFSEAGERTRRAAFRQLRAERAPKADLGAVAEPAAERPKLSYLLDQVGWAERGGRLLRERADWDQQDERSSGDVVGRTKWIPKTDPAGRPSSFWRDRPMRITESEAREAIRKFDAGEPLTRKQQRFIDYAIEWDRDFMAEGEEEAQRMRESGYDPDAVQEQDGGLMSDMERDAAIVSRAFDSDGTPDLGDVVPFSRRGTGDLFGAPTTAEQVEAERRRRDAERNGQTGTGRTDMAAGEGELFAGPRPEQTDIETPVGQPGNVRRTMRPPPPAEERAGPSWLEVDAETDALIDRARQEARRLAADTGEIAQRITRELGPNARRHITVVGQWADLPADVRTRAERAGLDERTEGFFDPRTGRVFILADERMTPERAVWVAFHETAGHLGLHAAMRRLAGDGPMLDTLVREFDRAGRNVTVSELARAIRRQNPDYGRMRSIEEALSELAAANRTGNWQEIKTRYGITVPPSMRSGVRTMLDSIRDAIRRFLNAVMGRDAGYTDGQVLRLLEDAWRDAQKAGQAARESDAMLSRTETENPVFYSALLEAVEGAQGAPRRGDAKAWKGWLDGAQRRGEFRQSERDWLGIDAWLDAQEGPVTREALADFIRANQVQVEEVVLGEPAAADRNARQRDIIGRLEREFGITAADDGVGGVDWITVADDFPVETWPDAAAALRDEWMALHAEEVVQGGPAKYESFQLPGGENYRELLLTLPAKDGDPLADKTREELGQLYEAEIGYNPIEDDPSISTEQLREYVRSLAPAAAAAGTSVGTGISGGRYQSSHWDQPDVLAHVRFNERTDADGKRVLFIEEIQSDWHQAGRKSGYGQRTVDGLVTGVPDAPFKATDEWAMLAFKRMARWAVDNGFDRIAWTTGEQQAGRYDLSKRVSSVSWSPDSGVLRVVPVGGQQFRNVAENVTAEKLDDYIGKEAAEKLRAAPENEAGEKVLAGDDLKIGGEGMRAFYDKILPAAVGKWAKKFGATVGKTEIVPSAMLPHNTKRQPVSVHSIDVTDAMRDAAEEGLPLFSRRATSDGRGQRSIEWNGETWVNRDGEYYLADANGQPRDFFFVREAEAEATRTGGEVRRDEPVDGERQTYSVTLPEGVRMDAERDFVDEGDVMFSRAGDPLVDASRRFFGTTNNPREAGYILPDGAMLDFSGRHYSEDHPSLRNQRNVDHRELLGENNNGESMDDLFKRKNASASDYMQEFMARTGAMRVDFNAGVASIMGEPTQEQIMRLARGLTGDYLAVSVIDPESGRIISEVEIDNPNPLKIRRFFESARGRKPDPDAPLFSRRPTQPQGDLLPPATEQEQRNAALSNAMARRSGLFGRLAAMGYPQGALTQQPGGEFRPVRKAVDEARRYLQDRMLPLRRAQEAAAGESAPGVTTPTLEDGMNAYRLENLMHGAVADKLRDADERFILRIQRMMKNSGVSADQLQDYLLARHAPERNARIASINPAMPDGGSGITTQEAADIMAGTAPGPYSGKPLDADTRRKAAAIAAVADEMRKETLAYMVKAGQITQQMADTLLKRYPNYVPLRGWKGEDTEAGQRTGRGLQAVRNAIKRALGRRSLPDNLLGELAGDLQRAIIASEKAKVGRALLRFALANPMPDLYTVEPVELEWKFSEATGEAYLGIRNSAEDIERSLVVKADDGTPVRIRFEDDALAQAIVNMNPVDAGGIVRTLGAVNRWRSSVLTRYNPGFAPVNMARDALFGVTAISAEKGADVAAATVATYPQALRAMWRDARKARGRTGVPVAQRTWDDWARSFAALGGKTGITRVEDVADLQRKMSEGTATLLELARQGKPWATTREAVGRALKPVADFIEAGNDATENAIRLAVFRQLVLDGTSEQQAAEYAKNVTINFNRKGEWGPALNAIYLFYNAAMQGTHATLRVMRNPKVAAFLGSLAVLQGVLASAMMGADDDEDGITAWDKVPDYVKRTSLVIPLGWATGNMDDYFALPMPYGFNLFTYGGGRGAQYMVLGERPTDTSITSDLFTATMDAFSPVPVTDGPRSVFGETIGFAMGLYGNKDDFGRPIVADRFAKDYVPRALLGRSDTPQIFHMLARASAKLGGGDLDKMIAPVGPLDIAPEQLEAVWNFATGGVGSIFNRSIRAGEQMAAGNLEGPMEMVTATPIVSRFVARGNTARAIADRYYREAEEMERNLAVLKERTRQQGVSDFDAILAEIQAEEPAMAGVELDRYKRSGKWGEAGEPKLTDTGAPRLRAAPGSPMESYRLASRETEDLNRLIRQLRVGGQTQAELVRMVDENVAGDTTALEALNLSDYNPEAPATTAQRNRAIKLVQDFRAQQQQEFIRAMNRARQTGRER